MSENFDYLNSLSLSQLENLFASHPSTKPLLKADEREKQRERMAQKRSAERDIAIPIPQAPNRRRDTIADGELFLTTYFPDVFFEPFTADRRDMHESIVRAARYGGDQAIAGTRGEGKTKLAIYTALYLTITGLAVFPIVIGKNQRKSESELRTVREKLQQSPMAESEARTTGTFGRTLQSLTTLKTVRRLSLTL
jgi:hypothetical protein